MIGGLLSNFSFSAQWNGGVFYFVLLTIVCYLFIIPTPKNHPRWKSVVFVVALILLAFTLGGPLNILARMIFRAHMIQMVILFFIVAPMLVLGTKRGIPSPKQIQPFIQIWNSIIIKYPIIFIILFHGLLLIYHIPSVFDDIRMSNTLNYFYLLGLFITALLLYSSLFSISDITKSFSHSNKWFYVTLNIMILLGFSSFLLITRNQLYGIYIDLELLQTALEVCLPVGETIEDIPEKFYANLNPFPPLQEQKIGGAILAGSQFFTLFLIYSFNILKGKKS
ncbi:putative membrane protein [Metabacillus crassostreae]|uniref:cytochrome c oxidase assembly protein n=1 Tax=Metabacillus crassostreae TaxID=929098 RepID=UPI00195DF2B0|nr:cytochrome c oxidase assembly protein [Metabacillus crassostreae]MBM7603012.1 putative membrane protein [Metabacillus crassostreae]